MSVLVTARSKDWLRLAIATKVHLDLADLALLRQTSFATHELLEVMCANSM